MKPENKFDDNVIRRKAMIVVGTEWARTYEEAAYQGMDSMNAINLFGITITSDGVPKSGEVTSDMKAIPIRLCDEGEENDLGIDWCQIRSPIDAIHCGVIPRWFPWNWIYNEDYTLPEFIDIDLGNMPTTGERIILACELVKVSSDRKNYFFCNIISDEDLKKYETRKLDHENKSGSERGVDMFFNKKKVEEEETPTTPETIAAETVVEPVTATTEEVVIDEKLNNDEQINSEIDTGDINVVETSESENIVGGPKMAEEKEVCGKPHKISAAAKKALKPTLWFLGGSAFGVAVTLVVAKVFGKKDCCDAAEVADAE